MCCLVQCYFFGDIMTVPTRKEVSTKDCWDLSSLYQNVDAWNVEFTQGKNNLEKVQSFSGNLTTSAKHLAEGLQCYLDSRRQIEKLYTYAHLKSDEDTSNTENLGRLQKAIGLYAELSSVSSYIAPELLALEESTLASYLKEECLKDYKLIIEETVRYRKHTLSPQEESILAQGIEVFSSCRQIFSQLNNADLDFGTIEIDGKKTPLTHSTYTLLLKNPDPQIRKQAFEQFYSVFDSHKNTISAAFAGSLKKDSYLSKVRKYNSCLEQSMFGDNVPSSVYSNLIDSVSSKLNELHRYYELRKRILKLDNQYIYDTYTPLVKAIKTNYSFDEAVSIVLSSLEPLGKDYTKTLEKGLLKDGWVDKYENQGKRSGAYSSGCYDSSPYILVNYKNESLNDMFTLTHESGHSMHSYLSRSNQLYQNSEYTIFVAEVASTFNEQLLSKELRKRYKDDKQLSAFLINQQIDDIKGTFFRQIMFAEFERTAHQMAESNQALTVDSFRSSYRELLAKYFGQAVTLNELDCLECLRIPHFYSSFYVYKYATGIAAAIELAQLVTKGGATERDNYLNFLKSGGTKHPLELLKGAGVDLSKKEPIEATVNLFAELIDELEEVLN